MCAIVRQNPLEDFPSETCSEVACLRQEEQDRPSLPKGVDPADPEPLTRSNAYTLELLKETSERSYFSRNPGVGFGLAEATH